jgi:hypothetical protein
MAKKMNAKKRNIKTVNGAGGYMMEPGMEEIIREESTRAGIDPMLGKSLYLSFWEATRERLEDVVGRVGEMSDEEVKYGVRDHTFEIPSIGVMGIAPTKVLMSRGTLCYGRSDSNKLDI